MPMFIVVIMVGSTFGIMLGGDSGVSTYYNDHKIKPLEEGYEIKAGDLKIYSSFHPEQVESIPSPAINSFDFIGKQAVIAFDPEQENPMYGDYARFQLGKFLNSLQIPVGAGATKEGNHTLPIVSCENATENTVVIVFKEGEITKIVQEDLSCYVLEAATPQDMIMVQDRFKLTLAGVMEGSN